MLRWWSFHPALPTVVLATLMMPSVRAAEPMPVGAAVVAADQAVPVAQPGYVYLGASMYPSPQPNIPIWTGSTFIPTPALAPHEMLYPHTYRALYPPYYHRVVGHYHWTPFGIKSHEKWELQGTAVKVKYRSEMPLFHGFKTPRISTMGRPWD